jgi:hypothetical protein
MRFGWIVLLLLSFPVLEAIGIFWAASAIGGWVLLWLLLAPHAASADPRRAGALGRTPAVLGAVGRVSAGRAVRQRAHLLAGACLSSGLHQRCHRAGSAADPGTWPAPADRCVRPTTTCWKASSNARQR